MGRELRLAFAMGGGVSLGTFSGAALSEVVKLAILRGRDGNGDPYDSVVVDVFSGASAGAMSLGIMLRSLVHRTQGQEAAAEARLLNDYGDEYRNLSPARREQMVAAQVMQDVQERVWGRDVTIRRLLGESPGGRRDLRHIGGILDRGCVEDIARETYGFPAGSGDPANVDLSGRRILGDRVLFACALSNLSPILHDATKDLNASEAGFLGLAEGLTSQAHRELRIFDLNFGGVPQETASSKDDYPRRWRRYHEGDKREGKGGIGDLRKKGAWSTIAATTIAAGAFPLAFEPVVLTRGRFEYGERLWPKELKDAGLDEYPFTFIDGGAFNNEPIRDAFRLAAFMDARQPENLCDRRIIFVDPFVEPPKGSFRVPIHRQFMFQGANVFGTFDGVDLVRLGTLDRLMPHVGSVLAAIMDEARTIEGDKIYQVRKRFDLRDTIRKFVDRALEGIVPVKELMVDLRSFCEGILKGDVEESLIPAGALTLDRELGRVIAEEERNEDGTAGPLAPLKGNGLKESVEIYLSLSDPSRAPLAALWLRALLFVAVDLIMDLEGKHRHSRLIAIAPVLNVSGPKQELVVLPGDRLFAFGGFTSRVPGRYEMDLARHCAREFLEESGMISRLPAPPPPPAPLGGEKLKEYDRDFKEGLDLLAARIGAMTAQSGLVNGLAGLDQIVLRFVAGQIEKAVQKLGIEAVPTTGYELRIEAPRELELDGSGIGDQDLEAIRLVDGGPWYLVLCLEHDGTKWIGPYIDAGGQFVPIDRNAMLVDRDFCKLNLPPVDLVRAAGIYPNPIFTASVGMGDKGRHLGSERWKLQPGVVPLEGRLLV